MTEREIAEQTPEPVLRELYALRGEVRTLRDESREIEERVLKRAAQFVCEWAKRYYPTSVFVQPKPGKHGKAVDGCSAAAIRTACPVIADEMLNDLRPTEA